MVFWQLAAVVQPPVLCDSPVLGALVGAAVVGALAVESTLSVLVAPPSPCPPNCVVLLLDPPSHAANMATRRTLSANIEKNFQIFILFCSPP